jgi:hypothetical protein
VAIRIGDVIELPEDSYKYGKGPIKLRVAKIRRDLLAVYDSKWVWLEGNEILWDGSEDRRVISILALVAALPHGTV